jgi:hypothetical protein
MRKKKLMIAIAGVFVVTVLLIGVAFLALMEPTVDGYPASHWVGLFAARPPAPDQAKTALEKLGPKAAAPYLVKAIGWETNRTVGWQNWYSRIYSSVPGSLRQRLPAPAAKKQPQEIQQARMSASYCLGGLAGKNAEWAKYSLPGLADLLRRTNAEIRFTASIALTGFGSNAAPIVPVIGEILKTRPAQVNDPMMNTLGQCPVPGKTLIPVLRNCLMDTNSPWQMSMARTLWVLDHGEADFVRPIAQRFSTSPDAGNRIEAATLLWRMDKDPDVVVPLLIGLLQDKDTAFDYRTILMLKAIGPKAKSAIPALTEWLRNNSHVSSFITNAAVQAIERMEASQ